MESGNFKLQFDPALIHSLAAEYLETDDGARKDSAMAAAGQRIVDGARTRENLEIIYKWKSNRSAHHLAKNDDDAIDRCLKQTIDACDDDRAAMASLIRVAALGTGLHGFQVPVASAVLTALYPKRFTVIDYRALFSLGRPQDFPNVDFYLEYLQAARDISERCGVGLRTLDRALWQWSKNADTAQPS